MTTVGAVTRTRILGFTPHLLAGPDSQVRERATEVVSGQGSPWTRAAPLFYCKSIPGAGV